MTLSGVTGQEASQKFSHKQAAKKNNSASRMASILKMRGRQNINVIRDLSINSFFFSKKKKRLI